MKTVRTARAARLAAAAALLTLLVAACSGGAATNAPIQRVAITTEAAPADVCMEALITGRLVQHPQWGLALQALGGGELMKPLWPFGYSAVVQGARIALLDDNGQIVAHTGDVIQSSGGNIGGEGNPTVALCDGTIEVVQG